MIVNAHLTSKSKQCLGIHVFESHDALVAHCGDEYNYRIVETKHRVWVNTQSIEEARKYHMEAYNRTKLPVLN